MIVKYASETQAPAQSEEKKEVQTSTVGSGETLLNGIDIEMYRYFDINPISKTSQNEQLKVISDWAMQEGSNILGALNKIKTAERRLGTPSEGSRITQLYNYVRLTNSINIKKQEMDEKVNAIDKKENKDISQVLTGYAQKIADLEKEIIDLQNKARRAAEDYRTHVTNKKKMVLDSYKNKIKELEGMRDVYKRRN